MTSITQFEEKESVHIKAKESIEEMKNEKENISKLESENTSDVETKDEKKEEEENKQKIPNDFIKREKYNETQINKIKNLISKIRNYFFRKKVKKLIQLQKENFFIISSVNEKDLFLKAIISEDEVKDYKLKYISILDQNIAFIPKDKFKKRLLLKCTFSNNKGDCIIDPRFNTEFTDDGIFINVINLKKMKEKEEERKEDFEAFLETYFTTPSTTKNDFEKYYSSIKGAFKEVTRVTKRHKTGKAIKGILKDRPIKRNPSDRKISFGNVTYQSYSNSNIKNKNRNQK